MNQHSEANLMPSNRFVIIDTELQTKTGHNFNATSRVISAAKAAGFTNIIVGCNRHFPIDGRKELDKSGMATICGEFASYAYDLFTKGQHRPAVEHSLTYSKPYDPRSFQRELANFSSKLDLTCEDIVYMHTFSAPIAEGLLQNLRVTPESKRPRYRILLYMAPDRLQLAETVKSSFQGILRRMSEEHLLSDTVKFFVETDGLQRAYRKIGFDFPILMGPIPNEPKLPLIEGSAVTVGYLGEARAEKGFWLVPEILSILFARWPDAASRARFVVQAKGNPGNTDHPYVKVALERLRKLASKFPNIEIIEDVSKDEYEQLLADVDIVLLPYELVPYSVRGSGVASEALASGKIVIAPAGIDICATFGYPSLISVDHYDPESFAEEIAPLLVLENLQCVDRSIATVDLMRYAESRFVAHLTVSEGQRMPRMHVPERSALLLCCAMLEGGIGMVQRAQIDMLNRLGFHVYCVFLPWPTTGIDSSIKEAELFNAIDSRREEYGFHHKTGMFGYIPFERTEASFLIERKLWDQRYQKHTMQTYAHRMNFVDVDAVEHMTKGRVFDHIIVNYPFYTGVLAKMVLDSAVPVVLETHDLQAKQMLLRRRDEEPNDSQPEYIEDDLIFEMRLADRAGTMMHISAGLAQTFAAFHGEKRHVIARPCLSLHMKEKAKESFRFVGRATKIEEILRKAGVSERPTLRAKELVKENGPERMFDLLFVGSKHVANQESIAEFIKEIYIPSLKPLGVSLAVAGTVCDALENYDRDVLLLGRVHDVAPLIMAARLNLLYVSEGTGFPTKVCETLLMGQAFSASHFGFYELAAHAEKLFPLCATPQEWIADILSMLLLRPLRAQRGAVGRHFAIEYFGEKQYWTAWGAVLGVDGQRLRADDLNLGHGELCASSNSVVDTALRERIPAKIWHIIRQYRPRATRIVEKLHTASGDDNIDIDAVIAKVLCNR